MADIISLYKTSFDPRKYAETYYSDNVDYEYKTIYIDFLHRLFLEGKLKGSTLLDVGCASTIHSVISASSYVENIYLSDLLEKSLDEVRKWLSGDSDAIDYTWQLKHVAKLEGHNNYHKIEERMRKAVKDVIRCNLLNDSPIHPANTQFDIVTSSLCLEVFPNINDYFRATKHLSSLIKPDGYLALLGTVQCSTYSDGNVEFPSACKDSSTSKRALEMADLKILEFNEFLYEKKLDVPTDNTGIFTAYAKKM